jgi:hypothetical protein
MIQIMQFFSSTINTYELKLICVAVTSISHAIVKEVPVHINYNPD